MKKRFISLLLVVVMLVSALSPLSMIASADSGSANAEPNEKTDAMTEIKNNLGTDSETTKNYQIGETLVLDDGGFVGAYELSIFFDKDNFVVKAGYHGTPIILYTVNTGVERIGKKTDTEIISSMLERGYVVMVADYLNSDKAVSPALDNSVSMIRTNMRNGNGDFFDSSIFPKDDYYEIHVCPAGYDVLLDEIFWSADKHGADGTLEKIVEIWNTDFRSVKGDKLVIWATGDSVDTRKTVRNITNANGEVDYATWYDKDGNVTEDGLYTKIKYTVANSIYDCVDPDGSMVTLDMYAHVVYPTVDETSKPVPVMAHANSSTYPTTSVTTVDDRRAHGGGFLFNGYAQVVYDYLYVPMARGDSWGYFSGETSTGKITGDNLTYSVQVYNDKLVNTAAMRYIRNLTLSEPDVYKFDIDAFGVYGNSKGGYVSFLGEEFLQSPLAKDSYTSLDQMEDAIDLALSKIIPVRYLNGHHGETRYQIGDTEDKVDEASGFVVRGGGRQPWLTFEGEEIISGAQLTYVANGSDSEHVSKGHSPMIVTVHLNDSYNAAYGESNRFANMVRSMNIPSFIVEVPLGHTITYGYDVDYDIDVYDAIFRFCGYYLKGDAVGVLYTTPLKNEGGVNVTDKITVKFTGEVSEEEIKKVTVTGGGEALEGVWTPSYHGTEWTFTPYAMKGGVKYTVNVPADLSGKNGVPMGKTFSSDFYTESDNADTAIEAVPYAKDIYFSFTAPSELGSDYNGYAIRFFVENDAANVAELYAVDAATFNKASVESASVGELVGKVNLRGSGSYEIDVTDYVAERAGENIVLVLKAQKTSGTDTVFSLDYSDGNVGNLSKDTYVQQGIDTEAFENNPVYKLVVGNTAGKFEGGHVVYNGINTAVQIKKLLPAKISADDYGRRFVFSIRIYDTVSRNVQLRFDTNTDRTKYATRDYDFTIINVKTVANQWTTFELPYSVYDTAYGKVGEREKSVTVRIGSTGDLEIPLYIDDVTVTEIVTDVDFNRVALAKTNDGSIPYKAPAGEKPLALYNGDSLVGEYDSWNTALSNYKYGYTLKLNSDYTLTDSDLFASFSTLEGAKRSDGTGVFDIDLNGYTVISKNTKNSLLWFKNTSSSSKRTEINVRGGAILLDRTALISYESSASTDAANEYSVNLKDTYIGLADGANLTEAMSTRTIAAGSSLSVSVSLTGCVLDFPDDKHAKDEIELLPAGEGTLDVFYTLDGGSIRLSAQKLVTVQSNAISSEFVDNVTGRYTTLVLPASKVANSASYLREDGYAIYAASADMDENGFVTYKLSKSENSTKYGIIDEDFADAQKYPWLVFQNGIFKFGYGSLKDASKAAVELVEGADNADSSVQILLRRDYENTVSGDQFMNLNTAAGEIILDLGGKTFVRNASVLLDFKADTTKAPYDTTLTVKNGVLRSRGKSIGDFQYVTNQTVGKTFNVIFDGVTFGLAENCDKAAGESFNLIWEVYNKGDYLACDANISLNDCTVDLDTNASKFSELAGITLFNIYDKNNRINVNVTVNGGEIKAPDMSKLTFAKTNSDKDTLKMGRGSNGEFMTASVTQEGGAVIGDNFTTTDGETRAFSKVSGSDSEYELTVNKLVTGYGVIPTLYSDVNAYPFALFYNGEFQGAFAEWGNSSSSDYTDVLEKAKSFMHGTGGAGKTVYVYLRRDYKATDTDAYYNLTQVGGTLVVDLGGNTFYVGKNDMLYAEGKLTDGKVHDTSVTVKNGSILTAGAGAVVDMRQKSALSGYEKKFNLTFENVTLGLAEGYICKQPLLQPNNGDKVACYFEVKFNGCTFDYATVAPNSNYPITLFHLGTDTNYASVTVNGGTLKFNSLANITFSKIGTSDNLVMAKHKDFGGKYPELKLNSSASPFKNVFSTADGNAVFIEQEDNGTTATYALTAVPYTTEDMSKYGDTFFSGVEYPFALFINGKLDTCKNSYDSAIKRVRELTASGTATVQMLLRSDYVIDSDTTNWRFINGTLVFDLGGHELTRGSKYLMNLSTSDDCLYKTAVIFKNGTIHNTRQLIAMSNTNSTAGVKQYEIAFEDVLIDYTAVAERELGNLFIIWTKKNGAGASIKLNFKNSVLDLRSAPEDLAVFDCDDQSLNAPVNVDVVFTGGKILSVDFSKIKMLKTDNAGSDTLRFAAYNGSFVTLEIGTGVALPTAKFDTTENYKAVFANVGGVYTLVPAEAKIIGANLNITENINVCYTVVAPAGSENVYMVFEFNGKTYTVTEYEEKDGKLVFKFLGVVPQKLGDNIKATLYATRDGETESNVVENYSVKTYCVNMLARTNDEKLKILLSDLLVYGAKSQLYTGYNVDNLVTDGVEGLMPSAYTDVTKTDAGINGEKNESVTWIGAALRYENEMAIKLVFKADAALVLKVSVNGRTVEFTADDFVTDENGNSVVYFRGIMATEYDEVVTAAFYDGETQVGESVTYSVNSYVYSKQAVTDAALAELVKATYNYGVSADLYKSLNN